MSMQKEGNWLDGGVAVKRNWGSKYLSNGLSDGKSTEESEDLENSVD